MNRHLHNLLIRACALLLACGLSGCEKAKTDASLTLPSGEEMTAETLYATATEAYKSKEYRWRAKSYRALGAEAEADADEKRAKELENESR